MLLQWHYFVLFNDRSIPLYMDTTSLSINFLPVHSFRLFPCLGYGEQCCYEYKGARIFLDYGFSQTYVQRWDCWIIWQFYFQYFEEPPVFLFTLFTVPRLDKAHVGKLEENLRNCGNCRHVYCLQAGTTAIAAVCWLYSLEADPVDTAIMQPQGLFRWSLYIFIERKLSGQAATP